MKQRSKKILSALLACTLTVSAIFPQLPVLPASAEPVSADEETKQPAEPDISDETAEPEAEPLPAVTTAPAEENESTFASRGTTACTTTTDDDCCETDYCCTTSCYDSYSTATCETELTEVSRWNWEPDLYEGAPEPTYWSEYIFAEVGEEIIIDLPYWARNGIALPDETRILINSIKASDSGSDSTVLPDYGEQIDPIFTTGWFEFTEKAIRWHSTALKQGTHQIMFGSKLCLFNICITEPEKPVTTTAVHLPDSLETVTTTIDRTCSRNDSYILFPYPTYTDENGNRQNYSNVTVRLYDKDIYSCEWGDRQLFEFTVNGIYLDNPDSAMHGLNDLSFTVSTPDDRYSVTYNYHYPAIEPDPGCPNDWNWQDDLYDGAPKRSPRHQQFTFRCGEEISIAMPYCSDANHQKHDSVIRPLALFEAGNEDLFSDGWYEFTDNAIIWHSTALKAGVTATCFVVDASEYNGGNDGGYDGYCFFNITVLDADEPIQATAAVIPDSLERRTETVQIEFDWQSEYQQEKTFMPYPTYTDADGNQQPYPNVIVNGKVKGRETDDSLVDCICFNKDGCYILDINMLCKYIFKGKCEHNEILYTISTPDNRYCVTYIYTLPEEQEWTYWNWRSDRYDGAPEESQPHQKISLQVGEEYVLAIPYYARNHKPLYRTSINLNFYIVCGCLSQGWFEFTDTAILWHTRALKAGVDYAVFDAAALNEKFDQSIEWGSYSFVFNIREPVAAIQTTTVKPPSTLERRTETVDYKYDGKLSYMMPYPQYTDENGVKQNYFNVTVTSRFIFCNDRNETDDYLIRKLEYTPDGILLRIDDEDPLIFEYTVSVPGSNYSVTYRICNTEQTWVSDYITTSDTTETAQKQLPCDINSDGIVDVRDAVLLMRISTEDTTLTVNETMLSQADINQDSFIDLTDVQILLRHLCLF